MRRTLLALLCLLAACQPLPHPFDDARALPPPSALQPPDSVGVLVAPAEGAPAPFGPALSEALAKALRAADVPASTEGGNRGSFRLETAAEEGAGTGAMQRLTVRWTLRDAEGAVRGSGTSARDVAGTAWPAEGDAVTQSIAAEAAPQIAQLIAGDAPLPTGSAPARVVLGGVTGAPGDGRTALASAIGTALGRAGVELGAAGAPSRFALSCEVAVAPADPGQQRVTVRWILAQGGHPLGQVSQQNTVPAGSLDHAWGDIAYAVAAYAAPGIAELINRAEAAPAGS
ncbi:MAG TPA: hypothetical protein VLV50_00165 [Stellaceae bacterium]|nr:hypothetical protein [Stellaceae bacterium]